MEESGALGHVQNRKLGFLFAARRTRSGHMMIKTSDKVVLWA